MELLSYGFDTIHYHVRVSTDDVAACVHHCDKLIAGGATHVYDSGVNGYRYTIQCDNGLKLYVPSMEGLHMGLWVIGGAAFCLSYSPEDYESQIDAACFSKLSLRLRMDSYVLRRFDLRFDMASSLPEFERDQIVSRGRYRQFHYDGDDFTGLTVGKGDVVFRMYDKIAEATAHGTVDRWRDVWSYDGSHVSRFEFQLRKDFLKQFGIERMADLLKRQGDVMEYLCGWLCFAYTQSRKDVDRPLVAWWQRFVEQVRCLPFECIGAVRQVLPKLPNVRQLVDQTMGLVSSLAAAWAFVDGSEAYDYVGVVNQVVKLIDHHRSKLEDTFQPKLVRYKQAAFS